MERDIYKPAQGIVLSGHYFGLEYAGLQTEVGFFFDKRSFSAGQILN
ncbi:MAG: hypothetical protein PHT07_07930 [Paludibacter sp.]|nr:hypothetical protein [Paludibacter sp.]